MIRVLTLPALNQQITPVLFGLLIFLLLLRRYIWLLYWFLGPSICRLICITLCRWFLHLYILLFILVFKCLCTNYNMRLFSFVLLNQLLFCLPTILVGIRFWLFISNYSWLILMLYFHLFYLWYYCTSILAIKCPHILCFSLLYFLIILLSIFICFQLVFSH